MLNVIKIGGNVIDNEKELISFLKNFAAINEPKILVHGGGKLATRLSEKLGIPTQMIDGRRVTDTETLQVTTMVYAGWINKTIVAQLQAIGCNAIGLSGADANLIPSVRRSPKPVNFGFVGDVSSNQIPSTTIQRLLEGGLTPVFCSITHDGEGTLLNSNADGIASSLAVALASIQPTRLVFCFEKNGVLSDPNDDSSYIKTINPVSCQEMKQQGTISKGMIPKLDSAFKAIDAGVSEVVIKHAQNLGNDVGTKVGPLTP